MDDPGSTSAANPPPPPKVPTAPSRETPGSPAASPPLVRAKYLPDKLVEAELLLGYAAEVGIGVEDEVREGVLKARAEGECGGLTEETASNLLKALTALAVSVRPVTVQSLVDGAKQGKTKDLVKLYGWVAGGVGGIIILFSLLTFMSSSVAEKIRADIVTANALASKLRSELGPSPSDAPPAPGAAAGLAKPATQSQDEIWFGPGGPPPGVSGKDVISDLQQFAATMREINGYAKQLKYYVLEFEDRDKSKSASDPKAQALHRSPLELLPGLDNRLSEELTEKVKEYQSVRNFGNIIQEKVTVYYGAIATCVLPVLYALLGAGAYLLRNLEDQIKNRTLVSGDRHVARFLIAGIGGLVVGLFNNVTQGITFSPFAVAFLVGYAADVFFTFLEGLLQIFKHGPGKPGASGTAQAPPA